MRVYETLRGSYCLKQLEMTPILNLNLTTYIIMQSGLFMAMKDADIICRSGSLATEAGSSHVAVEL